MCVGKNQLSLKAKDREKTSANLLVLRGARVTSKEKKNRFDDQTVRYIDRFIRSLNTVGNYGQTTRPVQKCLLPKKRLKL